MSDSPFNVALTEARVEAGMTVKDLAAKTGFTTGFVRSYEDCARNPTMTTIWRYAVALGLKVTITSAGVSLETREGAVLIRDWIPNGWGDEAEEE